MANIFKPIGNQNFEIVRDRIGRIIADEMNNQFQITYDPDLKVSVWNERIIPFDMGKELPSVNVMMAEDMFTFQTLIETIGTVRYFIDVYTNGLTDNDNGGDAKANWHLQKIIGRIRAILMHGYYKTLGFSPGFIGNRHVESIHIQVADQKRLDAEHNVMGRMVLNVTMSETQPVETPSTLSDFSTQVKLDNTNDGYLWVFDLTGRIQDLSFDQTFN